MTDLVNRYCPFCGKPMGDKAPIMPDRCYYDCDEFKEYETKQRVQPIWRHSRLYGVQVRDNIRSPWRQPTKAETDLIYGRKSE